MRQSGLQLRVGVMQMRQSGLQLGVGVMQMRQSGLQLRVGVMQMRQSGLQLPKIDVDLNAGVTLEANWMRVSVAVG